eukprot:7235433-Pyramimonas_sp.AAC.1
MAASRDGRARFRFSRDVLVILFFSGVVVVRAAWGALTPPPSLSKTIQSVRELHEHDSRLCPR